MVPRGTIEFISRVLWTDGGKALVCRNVKHGHCYLPGGHVEFGESAESAGIRELVEETGVCVELGPPLAIFESRFEQRGRSRHEVSVVFPVQSTNTAPSSVTSREPGISFEWISVEHLKQQGFVPHCQLELFDAGNRLPIWRST